MDLKKYYLGKLKGYKQELNNTEDKIELNFVFLGCIETMLGYSQYCNVELPRELNLVSVKEFLARQV